MRLFFPLFLLLASCAQPKYADEAATALAAPADQAPPCFHDGICVSYGWETPPTEESFGAFHFSTTKNGAPVDPDPAPTVLLWMPSMGHGSSPVAVKRLGVGEWRAEKVFFSMRGSWQLRFQLKVGPEVRDEVVLPYTF